MWTNETVHTGSNYGKDSVIALNSKDDVVIVYRRDDSKDDIYMSVGNRGSWTSSLVAQNRYAMWLSMAIDSNDDVHISSRNTGTGASYCCIKDMEYFTNASGSWVMTRIDQIGGLHAAMVIDANDDVHIAHSDIPASNDHTLPFKAAARPERPSSPSRQTCPGLVLNWKNGTVSGTPTEVHANTTHTVTVTALGATTKGRSRCTSRALKATSLMPTSRERLASPSHQPWPFHQRHDGRHHDVGHQRDTNGLTFGPATAPFGDTDAGRDRCGVHRVGQQLGRLGINHSQHTVDDVLVSSIVYAWRISH